MDIKMSTITLTFGDQAENNIGMQKIGQLSDEGFTLQDLQEAQKKIPSKYTTELIHLNPNLPNEYQADDAYILIIR
jgi:DNA-directed RNA polymerase specialized sigma54-like protein